MAAGLAYLERNWLPRGLMPGKTSYVPGPGLFGESATTRLLFVQGIHGFDVFGRIVYLRASRPAGDLSS